MMKHTTLLVILFVFLYPLSTLAGTFDPPVKAVCPDGKNLDNEKLLTWIIYTYNNGLSNKAITGGTNRIPTRDQLVAAVTNVNVCPTRDAHGNPLAKDKLPCGA